MMTATPDESARRMCLSKYVLASIARAVRRAIGCQPAVADVSFVLRGRLRPPVEKQHESDEDEQNSRKQHQFSFPWRDALVRFMLRKANEQPVYTNASAKPFSSEHR